MIFRYVDSLYMNQHQAYIYNSHFHFNDCDPAGIFYFGNVPNLCHCTYENWLTTLNHDWNFWFNNTDWIIPIRNCSIDYVSPMKAGHHYKIELSLSKMSQSSFTSQFQATDPKTGASYFNAQIVHVFVQKSNFQKTAIPESIRLLFKPYLLPGAE